MSSRTMKQQKNKKSENKEDRKSKSNNASDNLSTEKKLEKKEKLDNREAGLEFAKFKHETDEAINITEGNNTKYSKKIIESNWKKYEVPCESYEEREESDGVGADFEVLVRAPLAGGAHFQFRHERVWDAAPQCGPHQHYFTLHTSSLAADLLTVPFYRRNDLQLQLFSCDDIVSMNREAELSRHARRNSETYHRKPAADPGVLLDTLKECLKSTEENTASNMTENVSHKNVTEHVKTDSDARGAEVDEFVRSGRRDAGARSEESRTAQSAERLRPASPDQQHLEQWLDEFLSKG